MRIGWVGTGVMGLPMCGHLLRAGHALRVHSRTQARAEPVLAQGAKWADSAADAAADAEVVFSMVGFPEDVHETYLGSEGILEALSPGAIAVDMTTTRPSLAREIAARAAERDIRVLDAPVSGGDVGARNASLSIMVGGDRDAFDRVLPLLQRLGKQIIHQGGPGAGQDTKMCNQITIAGTMIGVCESLLYGRRAGLDLRQVLASIRGGAAGCWSLDNLAPRVLDGDFEPGFFVDHFVKDMEIALAESARMNLALPGLALVHQLYLALRAQGQGKRGTQALYLALDAMSGAQGA